MKIRIPPLVCVSVRSRLNGFPFADYLSGLGVVCFRNKYAHRAHRLKSSDPALQIFPFDTPDNALLFEQAQDHVGVQPGRCFIYTFHK
jgi:hypothetical protein